MKPLLRDLWIADRPALWEAIGFDVRDGVVALDGVRLHLGADGRGVRAWAVEGIEPDAVDGLDTRPRPGPVAVAGEHPNGVVAVDHFVIVTPDFDRTAAALERSGMPLRRVRDAGGFRQGFRRLGPAILELVEVHDMRSGAARFWGLTMTVRDLDALASRLGDRLRPIKDAVQPGRRIATLDDGAGLSAAVAFMTPERGQE